MQCVPCEHFSCLKALPSPAPPMTITSLIAVKSMISTGENIPRCCLSLSRLLSGTNEISRLACQAAWRDRVFEHQISPTLPAKFDTQAFISTMFAGLNHQLLECAMTRNFCIQQSKSGD